MRDPEKLLKRLEAPYLQLRAILERLVIEDLPYVMITPEGLDEGIPCGCSGIYFLWSGELGLVHIGRATNIRGRWQTSFFRRHHRLKQAIKQGDVALHWWAIPRELLPTAESILLQIHKPAWNRLDVLKPHRTEQERNRDMDAMFAEHARQIAEWRAAGRPGDDSLKGLWQD